MSRKMDPETQADCEYLNNTANQLEEILRQGPDAIVTRGEVLQILAGLCRRVATLQAVADRSSSVTEKIVERIGDHTDLLGVVVHNQNELKEELADVDDGEEWKKGRPLDDDDEVD